jgi:signal transduction histidine kinase
MGVATIHGFEFPVEYNESLRAEWITAIIPGLLVISLFIANVFEYAQKRALQQLANKNQQLVFQNDTITIQSEELAHLVEEKDYIIRILAHDLRSPLKNISTLIKLMDIEPEEGRRQEVLDIINRTAGDAENLVNKVLQLDRSQHIDFQPQKDRINIFSFLQLMADKMQGLANKKIINIDLTVSGDPSVVKADSTYLNLIFENLISNAIKFSPIGSTILIKALTGNKHVKITILDEGPGIAMNEIPLLFKKFAKLSPRPTAGESSTGLGLALVKRYTELVNGEVYYEQVPDNQGARFVIVLPILTS